MPALTKDLLNDGIGSNAVPNEKLTSDFEFHHALDECLDDESCGVCGIEFRQKMGLVGVDGVDR